MADLTMTSTEHFEAIDTASGLNPITNNPCKLLNFALLKLEAGKSYNGNSGDDEIMAVILGGRCSITVNDVQYENIGKRPNVFSGKPYAVYIPPYCEFSTVGVSNVEVALCHAK